MSKIDEINKLLKNIKEYDDSFEKDDLYTVYTDFDNIKESIKLILETFSNEFLESQSDLKLSTIEKELLEIISVIENLKKGLK